VPTPTPTPTSTSTPTPTPTSTPTSTPTPMPSPASCPGVCVPASQSCPSGTISRGTGGCKALQSCHRCGFLRLKKCCDYTLLLCCVPIPPTPTPEPTPILAPTSTPIPTSAPTPIFTPTPNPTPYPNYSFCPYKCRPAKREGGWSKHWVTKCEGNEIAQPMFSCPAITQCYSCGFWGMRKCCDQVNSICCRPK